MKRISNFKKFNEQVSVQPLNEGKIMDMFNSDVKSKITNFLKKIKTKAKQPITLNSEWSGLSFIEIFNKLKGEMKVTESKLNEYNGPYSLSYGMPTTRKNESGVGKIIYNTIMKIAIFGGFSELMARWIINDLINVISFPFLDTIGPYAAAAFLLAGIIYIFEKSFIVD